MQLNLQTDRSPRARRKIKRVRQLTEDEIELYWYKKSTSFSRERTPAKSLLPLAHQQLVQLELSELSLKTTSTS